MQVLTFGRPLDAAMPPPITTPVPDTLPLPPTPHPAIDPLTDPPPAPVSDPPVPDSLPLLPERWRLVPRPAHATPPVSRPKTAMRC